MPVRYVIEQQNRIVAKNSFFGAFRLPGHLGFFYLVNNLWLHPDLTALKLVIFDFKINY